MRLLIATLKSWNINNAHLLKEKYKGIHEVEVVECREGLNERILEAFNPDYIFFPHWSWKIPSEVFKKYECIVFHMTDLPYGRGGSPLQNLIVRGKDETKISAIRVCEEVDAGDIYMKEDLSLVGNADEILSRASDIVFSKMMPAIVDNRFEPKKQQGEVVVFERRKKEQSEIESDFGMKEIYNHIRMLDGEGYPGAFIKFGKYKLVFSKAAWENDGLKAVVEFVEEENE